jgi:hypothetical protein
MFCTASRTGHLGIAFALTGVVALGPIADAGGTGFQQRASIKPKGGSYKGLTAQGKRGRECPNPKDPFGPNVPCQVTFKVKKRVVKNASFGIAWPACSTSFPLSPHKGKVNRKGRFRVTEGDSVMKGRFVTRTKVKGTVTGDPVNPGPGCSGSRTIAFTAKRVR